MMRSYIEAQYRAWMFLIRWVILPTVWILILTLVWIIWVTYNSGTDTFTDVLGYYITRLLSFMLEH